MNTQKTDDGTLLSPPTCSAFESYWDARGVTINPPIMREAMKEVAWKSWQACASHAVLIADSWQHETPSILRMKLLPNAQVLTSEERGL